MPLLDHGAMAMVMVGHMDAQRLQQLAEAPRQHELQRCPDTEDGFKKGHMRTIVQKTNL